MDVHDYTRMPVADAAQAVQHSADGAAYGQWTAMAAQLAGYFTGSSPHGVSCWYQPPPKANLAGAGAGTRQDVRTAGAASGGEECQHGSF